MKAVVKTLLLADYDQQVDSDLDDDELCEKVASYYQAQLDTDTAVGFFREDEVKCIIYLYEYTMPRRRTTCGGT